MIDFSRRDVLDRFAVAAGLYSTTPVERAEEYDIDGKTVWAHPGHLKVLKALEEGERKILPVCGVRWGKTLLDAFLAFYGAMSPGKNIWIVSPTYELGAKAWFYLIEMLHKAGLHNPSHWRSNKQRKRIDFAWGSFVQLRSADKPDSLASEECDLIIGEEFAKSKPRTWMRIRSRLIDRTGQVILPSTPEGFNHYYDLFASESFWTIQSESQANPWLSLEELEAMRKDMGACEYAQEVEAQFTAMTGAVFAEFNRTRHIVDWDVSSWPVSVVVDPGLNDPCAITWIAHHPEGKDVVIRSMRLQEQAAAFPNVLKQIRKYEPPGGYEAHVYDPWGGDARSQETMQSFRSWMRDQGLHFTAHKMGKRARILAVRSRLENIKGEARLFFLDVPETRSIIQAVSSWHYPEGERQADPVHDINSHECDNLCNYVAWRYKRGQNRGWVA